MSNLLAAQKTHFTKNADIQKEWLLLDASEQSLGRLASYIAYRLQGKERTNYAPHQDIGNYIVVINAAKVAVSGKKREQKLYYRHTLYPGGLRSKTLGERLEQEPVELVRSTVKGMLPKGALGRRLLSNLKIYADQEHPHEAQRPTLTKPPIVKNSS